MKKEYKIRESTLQCVKKSIIIYAEGAVEMEEKEFLQAILKKLGGMEIKIDGLEKGQAEINDRLSSLEEDSKITRSGVNTLLDWAEKVQVQVSIPLYRKDGD
jgi:hypothetical protein